MFIINLTYTKPLSEIAKIVDQHRAYLKQFYESRDFLFSGPKIPKDGGLIVSSLKDKAKLIEILENDPYLLNDMAKYEIIEFDPVMHLDDFKDFV